MNPRLPNGPRTERSSGRGSALARPALIATLSVGAALTALATGPTPSASAADQDARPLRDPCRTPPIAARLLCPDLRIARPSHLWADRKTRNGRVLLRATNDIRSRGAGPMELRGRRDRERSMNVTQAIRRRAGGYRLEPTQARLRFFDVGGRYGGAFWKVRNPLRFELWRIDRRGRLTRRVRTGPKQFYCFRDLERTAPGPRSPADPVYPACNQNPLVRRVTLGTSVGWSDIYPSGYDLQWIDVTGLRGCFAYVMRLDPGGTLFESNKANNVSRKKVRLPYRRVRNQRC